MAKVMLDVSPWTARKQRAGELAERWPFAAEVLTFYANLCAVQERAFDEARHAAPRAADAAAYAAERVMPAIIEVSAASGPATLMQGVLERFHAADMAEIVRSWLRGVGLGPIDRFLARAASGPVLEALAGDASAACDGPRDERHCPVCAGAPQLAYFAASSEDLVTGHRYLVCSRCANEWAYPRMTCASCGENEASRLRVYAELGTMEAERTAQSANGPNVVKPGFASAGTGVQARFGHMRADGCASCSRYVLTVDMARDARAVPLVDELGALPLDLYAKDLGFTKIVPNLLGF
jgi:formate dehydrogenase maturation protein FdhE